jgi:hypothetical protein
MAGFAFMNGLLLLGLTLNPEARHESLVGFWVAFVVLAAYVLKINMRYVDRMEAGVTRLKRELRLAGRE